MYRDKLGIYLNDHLTGATFGIGLAQRIAHQHRHSARSADLQRICDEIAQDRRTLLEVMDALDVPARRYKVSGAAGAFEAERRPVPALRAEHVDRAGDPAAGSRGEDLAHAARRGRGGAPLGRIPAAHLLDRARDQIDTLEMLRLAAAAAVFSPGARSVTPDSP
ncbi:hypothetical protein [Streptomyces sp. C10]|uniref:hypothetical protein n=1 Tax=Streptomyces sp. C10 TaxID=531941 RepID=UPI0039817B2A